MTILRNTTFVVAFFTGFCRLLLFVAAVEGILCEDRAIVDVVVGVRVVVECVDFDEGLLVGSRTVSPDGGVVNSDCPNLSVGTSRVIPLIDCVLALI